MPNLQPPYTERDRRKARSSAVMIGGLFLFTIVVFGILLGAGEFIHGS